MLHSEVKVSTVTLTRCVAQRELEYVLRATRAAGVAPLADAGGRWHRSIKRGGLRVNIYPENTLGNGIRCDIYVYSVY